MMSRKNTMRHLHRSKNCKLRFGKQIQHMFFINIHCASKTESATNLQNHLTEKGVPANIYYPVPLNEQKAFKEFVPENLDLPVTEMLCREVISLPIHTEMNAETQNYIIDSVKSFFTANAQTA